jgi:hypothetical protein
MIWFLLFIVCSVIAITALVLFLGLGAVRAFAICAERSLAGFHDKHVVVASLYAILGGWFAYLVVQGILLACSFCQAVVR